MLSQNTARRFKQYFSGVRQSDAARRAYEQGSADFAFKLPYLHADGCLCDVNAASAGRERAGLGDGDKGS